MGGFICSISGDVLYGSDLILDNSELESPDMPGMDSLTALSEIEVV